MSNLKTEEETNNNNDDRSVKIVIIRSSDGKQTVITTPSLHMTTLYNLKDLINTSPLGPLPRHQQRLFHLGREIKLGKRSLESLGIGRFNVYSLHLHCVKRDINVQSDDDVEIIEKVEVVDVTAESNGDGERGEKVVNLLDSDSDDDIEVVSVTVGANKRRRKNEVTIE